MIRARGFTGADQFIPCCNDCHLRAAINRKARRIHGRGQGQIRRGQAAWWGHLCPCFEISACRANMGCVIHCIDHDMILCGGDILLDHNMIGPLRQRGARENTHRLTLANLALPCLPCGGRTHHPQPRAKAQIRVADCIAIHRRGRKGRLITHRHNRPRQNPPCCMAQGDIFNP